jgi:hypothetical protein
MENISSITDLIFIVTTAFSIWLFNRATGSKGILFLVLLALAAVYAMVAKMGFFTQHLQLPPAIVFVPATSLLLFLLFYFSKAGRGILLEADLKALTLLHIIRIPVELVLYMLYKGKTVPELMTFAGSNPDIISGITAPIAVYLFWRGGEVNKVGLLIWNVACLALLANIVVRAALSVPTPLQQFGFEQSNIAILYFPYVWLPGIVVPIVLAAHLASIRQLMRKDNSGAKLV